MGYKTSRAFLGWVQLCCYTGRISPFLSLLQAILLSSANCLRLTTSLPRSSVFITRKPSPRISRTLNIVCTAWTKAVRKHPRSAADSRTSTLPRHGSSSPADAAYRSTTSSIAQSKTSCKACVSETPLIQQMLCAIACPSLSRHISKAIPSSGFNVAKCQIDFWGWF